MSDIPEEVLALLRDGLTERGCGQWWQARNRYLDARRPCDLWPQERERVLEAASAYSEGIYL